MNNLEARIILEKLFEGVHPETGELFAEDHVCNEAQVLRALHRAIVALNSQPVAAEPAKKARQSHENSKKAWAQEEDAYLRNACRQEIPLDEICRELGAKRVERSVSSDLSGAGRPLDSWRKSLSGDGARASGASVVSRGGRKAHGAVSGRP